jgi:hypothetical protein
LPVQFAWHVELTHVYVDVSQRLPVGQPVHLPPQPSDWPHVFPAQLAVQEAEQV